jgi:ankyrin repeat protein/nucleoside phosphorylase
MLKRRRPRTEDFAIGWICAIDIEFVAAREILDERYDHLEEAASYILGRIGGHDIVIGCLPAGQYGTNPAAALASEMKTIFPNIHAALVVGVAGGVPHTDIRLGDAVISLPRGANNGVVQYDFVKTIDGQQQPNISLSAPPASLLKAVAALRSDPRHSDKIRAQMTAFSNQKRFQRPTTSDVLFQPDYVHIGGDTCDQCLMEKEKITERTQREGEEIVLHYGMIGSGNRVIKDGISRDNLSNRCGGIMCFETEAAGVMHILPCLVIRGICDYADSHKNKVWQPFAAAAAASCAKIILSFLPTRRKPYESELLPPIRRSHQQSNYPDNVETNDSCDVVRRYLQENDPDHLERNESLDLTATGSGHQYSRKSILSQDQIKRYIESLRFDQIDSRYHNIDRAHPDTCSWILEKAEFHYWLTFENLPEHHGFLWIKGNPATGKSTIMKYILESVSTNNIKPKLPKSVILKFFFNARGADIEKSTEGMYRSLLFNLLQQLPDLQHIFTLRPLKHSDVQGAHIWDTKTLQDMFRLAIGMIGQQSVICLIDALDECDESQVREMVEFFESLGQFASSNQLQFRTCFSSRHYPHITLQRALELVLEQQDGHTTDIEKYVKTKLRAPRTKLGDEIRTEIVRKSSGIFLWVVLVVKILNEDSDHGQIHRLKRRLGEIPKGLHELFGGMLSRDSKHMNNLISCLQWLLFSTRPLKPEELYYAIRVGVEPESITPWDPEEIDQHSIQLFILSSSKGLAEITKQEAKRIQFIHESVRDYLLKDNGLQRLIQTAGNFAGMSHLHLRDCCQSYISIYMSQRSLLEAQWDHSNQDAKMFRQFVTKKFPFLEYATRNLLQHADAAAGYGLAQDDFVITFSHETWVEVQDGFVKTFSRETWIEIDNILDEDKVRCYSSQASLLYIFTNENALHLIGVIPYRGQNMDMESENELYCHPIIAAVVNGNEKSITALLEPEKGNPSESSSSQCSAMIQKPLVRKALCDNLPCLQGRTALQWALEEGKVGTCWKILDIAKKENLAIAGLNNTLYVAAMRGNKAIVKLLVELGASVNAWGGYFGNALQVASLRGYSEVTKVLLEAGAKVNAQGYVYGNALQAASYGGQKAVVELLLANGADTNALGGHFGTALQAASFGGNLDVVELLLAEGVDVNARGGFFDTALQAASCNGCLAVVTLLLAKGADINAQGGKYGNSLQAASCKGCLAVVTLLLAKGADINAQGGKYGNSLQAASCNGHQRLVKFLLAKGAKVNFQG